MEDALKVAARARGRPVKSADERQEMKALIAQTARQLFQEESYATVSIRRLAKAIGCSPMTLYKYYDSKIAILQTLWAVVFTQLFSEMEALLSGQDNPAIRLRTACRHYVGYWLDHPEHYRLVFMAEGVTQPEVSLFIDNPEISAGFDLLAATIAGASNPASDAMMKVKIDLVMGALHGIAHNQITISGYAWTDHGTMIDHLIDNIV